MFVVVKRNYSGYEDGYSVSSIYGPFSTIEEANSLAKSGNSKNSFGEYLHVTKLKTDADLKCSLFVYD